MNMWEGSPADRFTKASDVSQHRLDPESISEMEDILKEMTTDCINGKISYLVEPINTPFFQELYKFLLLMRHTDQEASPFKLGSRLSAVFQFVKEAGKHEDLRTLLRDSYGLLAFSGCYFDTRFVIEERSFLMEAMEVMTRGFTTIYKPTYMLDLVKKVFEHLLEVSKQPFDDYFVTIERIRTTLQFLVNICQNESCLLVVLDDQNYKAAFHALGTLFLHKDQDVCATYAQCYKIVQRADVLFVHLLFLLGSSIPHDKFDSGYRVANKYTESELSRRKKLYSNKSENTTTNHTYLSESLHEVYELVVSIVKSMKDVYLCTTAEEYSREPRWCEEVILRNAKSKLRFEDLINDLLRLLLKFMEVVDKPHVEDTKGILTMTLALIPTFGPKIKFIGAYKSALMIGKLALRSVEPDPILLQMTISIFHHVTEQIADDRHKINPDFKDMNSYFVELLKVACFSKETQPVFITSNTLLARLLFSLSSYPGFREQITQKLDSALISEVVDNILNCETGSPKQRMERSVCLVELLCTLAERPEVVDLFMKLVSREKVCEKIAHCIHHGSERATTRALRVIGSAPFDHNNLPMITNGLMNMRIQGPPLPQVPRFTHDLSPLGTQNVDTVVDAFTNGEVAGDNKDPTSVNYLMTDLLAFHKVKTDLHRVERENLQSQVQDMNRANLQLHRILELQNEFVSKRLMVAENQSSFVLSLQHDLAAAKKATDEKERAWTIKVQAINDEHTTEKLHSMHLKARLDQEVAKNTNLKKDFDASQAIKTELTEKLATATTEKRNYRSEANRLKNELSQTKTKVASLEEEVKKKEEERANALMLLDKEKKMLDTIRGLVGNNFGNLNLG